MRRWPVRMISLLILLLAGCSGVSARGGDDPFGSSSEGQLSIFILNDNRMPVTVRVVSGGGRVDIGTIDPRGQRVVTVGWDRQETLRFRLEVLGGRAHTTRSLLVAPGDRVELWITDPVQRSVVRQ